MIENAPDPKIFLQNSAEFMYEAFQIILSLMKDDFNTFFENDISADEGNWLEETHSVKIGTVSLLIFTSIENYLKYKICTESPFLLISSLSDLKKGKTDFNEYHMHSFEDLLKVYITIYGITDDDRLKTKFEMLRKTRNSFVHSILNDGTLIKDLLESAAFFVKEVWNNKSNHPPLFHYFADRLDPLADYHDVMNFTPEYEDDNDQHAELLAIYEILNHYLTKNEALSFLGLSKTDRLMICPVCSIYSYRNRSITCFRFAKFIVEDGENFSVCQLCQAEVLVKDTDENPQNLLSAEILSIINQSQ
ncbi:MULTISPECIES: hypothetical protein [Acinetobacter]|uniref:Uncharacterized protein n=1 Tax=Acinetobacter higginsii TaxID=70347 RepID=N8WAR2_9GAMM|nr:MULTISPECIES: hypothetical protein [Acinetobacter]ENV09001.1 hypothetical protein F966_02646 [Acinetobacter higginsii]NNP67521.1 hypothetical protein [Acinetobacter sp. Ac_5812]